jgi:type I restriction enzyme S subunit
VTITTRWPTVALGTVATFYAGASLPEGAPFDSQQDGYLLARVSDMNLPGNEIYLESTRQWSALSGPKSATCPAASVVIPKRGGAIGTNKKRMINRPCILDPNLMGISPHDDRLDVRFLYHWLLTFDLSNITNGSSVPQLNKKDLSPLTIPLPPIDVQRHFGDVLDQADGLRIKRRVALQLLEALVQSEFIEMFGNPVSNPNGWDWKPLTQVCHCYSGGTPPKSDSAFWSGSVPWFSPKDLKNDDLFDSQDHISDSAIRAAGLKLLPPNTVAIGVRGMILRHTFPVSVLRVPATINQDLKALLPRIELAPQFLATCLRVQSWHVLQQISSSAHGTARLDSGSLGKIPILLPPAALQRKFDSSVAQIQKCIASHEASLEALESLFASLQHRAFSGKL